MFSIINIGRTLITKIVTFLYIAVSVVTTGVPVDKEFSKAGENFEPVVRFAVCSDVHLDGKEDQGEAKRFAKLFDTSYKYAQSQEYKNLDAVLVAGDMTNGGLEEQYNVFNKVVSENLKEGTELLVCTGNHEYISYDDVGKQYGARMFEKMLDRELDTHTVINGYHFIGISYCDDGKTFTAKKKWINAEIKKAIADGGDRPVFVFQHPAPFATVYGSIHWGDFDISLVLSKYPQVIDFSGHSHYPVNDPRSIWQGTFTALGCGTLSYFETELDYIAGNFPYQSYMAAQFYIVEADRDGNVRVMPYDLITDKFFDNEYYLTDLSKRNFEYNFLKMKNCDTPPVFGDGLRIETAVNENGETVLTFEGAKNNTATESYKLSVTCNGLPVFSDAFSGKYMYLFEEDKYEVNLGVLKEGKKYSVQIVAFNAYGEASKPLTYKFTA